MPVSSPITSSIVTDSTTISAIPIVQDATQETSENSFNVNADTNTEAQNTTKRNRQQLLDSLKFLHNDFIPTFCRFIPTF